MLTIACRGFECGKCMYTPDSITLLHLSWGFRCEKAVRSGMVVGARGGAHTRGESGMFVFICVFVCVYLYVCGREG